MAEHEIVAFDDANDWLAAPQGLDTYVAKRAVSFEQAITTVSVNGRNITDDGTKLDLLTVTSSIDLDALAGLVAGIGQPVVLKGSWDASLGTFPTSTVAGESWIVSVAGIVDGIQFNINDRVLALINGASNVLYLNQWLILDYTDQVLSVNGLQGAVSLSVEDILGYETLLTEVDINTLLKLNTFIGDATLGDAADFATAAQGVLAATALQPESIDSLAELNALVLDATLDDVSGTRDPNAHVHDPADVTGTAVITTDSRLSDARTPVAHSHIYTDMTTTLALVPCAYATRKLASGAVYLHGFYKAPAADANLTQASPTITYGAANGMHPAHVFMVFGAGSTDGINVTLTVTGTSWTDAGVRTAADSEVLYTGPVAGLTLNDYLETSKKFVGTVTFTLTSDGVNFTMDFNYGLSKYYDYNNHDFAIDWVEFTGQAEENDTGFDIEIIKHTTTGYTYSAAAFDPVVNVVASSATDMVTEKNLVAGEEFAWKHVGLSADILGTGSEGFMIRVTTTVNDSITFMNGGIGLIVVHV